MKRNYQPTRLEIELQLWRDKEQRLREAIPAIPSELRALKKREQVQKGSKKKRNSPKL